MSIPMHNVHIEKHEFVCPVLASLFHCGCHEKPCHPICSPALSTHHFAHTILFERTKNARIERKIGKRQIQGSILE